MKCEAIDFLEYIEGVPSEEVLNHIKNCKRCQRESEKVSRFSRLISTHYSEGKKVEEELENRLRSIDYAKMKKLPANLQKKVAELKEKSLVYKIKKVIGKARESEERLIERLMMPRVQAMPLPASPKDITKSRKTKPKKKSVKKKNK